MVFDNIIKYYKTKLLKILKKEKEDMTVDIIINSKESNWNIQIILFKGRDDEITLFYSNIYSALGCCGCNCIKGLSARINYSEKVMNDTYDIVQELWCSIAIGLGYPSLIAIDNPTNENTLNMFKRNGWNIVYSFPNYNYTHHTLNVYIKENIQKVVED